MTSLTPATPWKHVFPIYQGDDLAALDQAAADGLHTSDLDAYNKLVTAADERAQHLTVTALPRRKWRDLVDANPARQDSEDDKAFGYNVDTLAEAILPLAIAPGQFDNEILRDAFLDALSDAQYSQMAGTAAQLNALGLAAPKALTPPSVPTPSGDETSTSPTTSD